MPPQTRGALADMLTLAASPLRDRAGYLPSEGLAPERIDRIFRAMQDETACQGLALARLASLDQAPARALADFLARRELELFHVVRLLSALDLPVLKLLQGPSSPAAEALLRRCLKAANRCRDLRDLAEALEGLGGTEAVIAGIFLDRGPSVMEWDQEALWPWFWDHLDLVHEALSPPPGAGPKWLERYFRPVGALKLVPSFPTLPPALVLHILEQALNGPATWRWSFEAALEKHPDLDVLLQSRLRSRRGTERARAAEWLGRRGAHDAVEALRHCAARDRSAVVRSAALEALERLGTPPDTPHAPLTLLQDARAGLRPRADRLTGLFASVPLPTVRWMHGPPAPGMVLEWLLARARKLGAHTPDRWLMDACRLLEPGSRGSLARWLLDTWLAPLERPKWTPHEAEQKAERRVRSRSDTGIADPTLVAKERDGLLAERLAPDNTERGVLAVVAACGDGAIVSRVAPLLLQRHFLSTSLSCSLLEVLSYIEDPAVDRLLEDVVHGPVTAAVSDAARTCLKGRMYRAEASSPGPAPQ